MLIKVARAGKMVGEYTVEALRVRIRNQSVLPSDHYWFSGMSGWELISSRDWANYTPAAVSAPPPPASPGSAPANPAVPAEKARTNVRGRVLDYNIATSTGILSGDDGIRYNFTGSEWKSAGVLPNNGVQVDFVSDGYTALEIYAVSAVVVPPPASVAMSRQPAGNEYYRSSDQGMLGGVCAGLAHKWGRPRLVVRATFVIATLVFGVGVFIYIFFWLAWSTRRTVGNFANFKPKPLPTKFHHRR